MQLLVHKYREQKRDQDEDEESECDLEKPWEPAEVKILRNMINAVQDNESEGPRTGTSETESTSPNIKLKKLRLKRSKTRMSMSIKDMSIAVAIAPIFGFLGRVGTNAWYSIILLVIVLGYLIMGAFVFQELETGEKYVNITDYKVYRREFLMYFMSNPEYGYNGEIFTTEDWATLKAISSDRCFKADAASARPYMWNFWSSMDFASTILTTVGYGGMAPKTTMGKMFCIVYALPGMALMMAYLNLFSMCILIILKKVVKLLENCVRLILKQKEARLSRFVISIILLGISLLMLATYLTIMSWRMTAANRENDPLLKSFYFYVITMTTVGIGDIAMIDYIWWGVLAKVMFIFCIGLALVTTVFGALRGVAEENRKRIVKATRIIAERAKGIELLKRTPKDEQLLHEDMDTDSLMIGQDRDGR